MGLGGATASDRRRISRTDGGGICQRRRIVDVAMTNSVCMRTEFESKGAGIAKRE